MAKATQAFTPAAPARRAIDLLNWITQAAFILLIALVMARATMIEMLRDPFQATPGAVPAPAAPGPGTALVLDLACCLPALLVLLRGVLDKKYSLRWAWSFAALIPLTAWMLLSARWADDKFACIVYSCQFAAFLAMLWATAQLVRSWLRLRIIAGLCFGLLLAYLAQGFMYEAIDVPELRQNWVQNKDRILKEHGWEPGSFIATQFEKNVTSGELVGFDVSPNSFAAVIVLLTVLAAGAAIQRWRDAGELAPGGSPARNAPPAKPGQLGEAAVDRIWAGCLAAVIPLAAIVIAYTRCRAAFVTPMLAAGILVAVWRLGPWLRRNARLAYAIVVASLVLIGAFLVHHGVRHNTLFHDSLTFRWHYWVGAWRMYFAHPWVGVGWANFGQHYLATRLPEAAEEIRDPHNFLLRFFLELGAVGGTLALAWIGRLWWEWTVVEDGPAGSLYRHEDKVTAANNAASAMDDASQKYAASAKDAAARDALDPKATAPAIAGATPSAKFDALPTLLAIVAAAFAINLIASVDFQQQWEYTTVEIMKRLLFACALLVGGFVVSLRSLEKPVFDHRPAPWLLTAIVASIGVFLIHNLIEFAIFEPGPMFVFALLAGSALGLRLPANPPRKPAWITLAVLAGALAAWAACAALVAAPTIKAETLAADAAMNVMGESFDGGRTRQPTQASINRAVEEYVEAFAAQPLNADYAYQAGRVMSIRGDNPQSIIAMLSTAIAADPSMVSYYRNRADLESRRGDFPAALADLKQASTRDPNNVEIHIAYGDALANTGDLAAARREYQTALDKDDLLDAAEPKRMTASQREELKEKIAKLG